MLALEVLVAVAVLVGVALLATGRFGGDALPDDQPDIADLGLPAGRLLRSDDIGRLRFRAVGGIRGGLRGYRMEDVDMALVQVHAALVAAEQRMTDPSPPIHPAPPPAPAPLPQPEPLSPPPVPPIRPEPSPEPEPPLGGG